jgi:hypothetical protein
MQMLILMLPAPPLPTPLKLRVHNMYGMVHECVFTYRYHHQSYYCSISFDKNDYLYEFKDDSSPRLYTVL